MFLFFKQQTSFIIRFIILSFSLLLCAQNAYAKEQVPWLIYLYMVGSDLETGDEESSGGLASEDLAEIMQSHAGENVKILIMTGGAKEWKASYVSSQRSQIYELSNKKLNLVADWNLMNMGQSSTLANLLNFGESKYDPQHRIIIFWNHGGGPTSGVGFDEVFSYDYLGMNEITQAFAQVYDQRYKPFEIIGFDACLMATLPVAYAMNRWGHVLVASEDVEPGTGWMYTPWLNQLEKNPHMNLRTIGDHILNSYVESFKESEYLDQITLSVTSLDVFPSLMLAYNQLGLSLYDIIHDDNGKLINLLDRAAKHSETYGDNSKADDSYTDSIDLKHYVSNLKSYAPSEVKEILAILDKYVLAKFNGALRQSSGISVYYPIGKEPENHKNVMSVGPSTLDLIHGMQITVATGEELYSQKDYVRMVDFIDQIHSYLGELAVFNKRYSTYIDDYHVSQASVDTEAGNGTSSHNKDENGHISSTKGTVVNTYKDVLAVIKNNSDTQRKDISSLENIPILFDDNNNAYVKVPKDLLDSISFVEVAAMLYEFPSEKHPNGLTVMLGTDIKLRKDWETGIFTDTISGYWPALDGHILPLEITNVTDDYAIYGCNVKINGILYKLSVAYYFKSEKYSILGAHKINANGIPDRLNKFLKPGDKITTIFQVGNMIEDEGIDTDRGIELETFTYTSDSTIKDCDIGKSEMIFAFTFVDGYGNIAMSKLASLSKDENGDLYIGTFEEAWGDFVNSDDEENAESNDVDSEPKSALNLGIKSKESKSGSESDVTKKQE